MKRIKIISDLHISDEYLQNNFMLDEDKFVYYLEKSLNDYDMVVFNGDIFELWETTMPFMRRAKFKKIQENKPELYKFIQSNVFLNEKVFYIYGNHDYWLHNDLYIPFTYKKLLLTVNGCKIFISHGHQPDFWNNGVARLGEFFTWLGAWFERLFFFNVDSKIIDKCVRRELVMLKYAKIKAKKHNADIVVLGHLHKYTKREDENFIYVTTGKCCGRENEFDEVTIEIEKDGSHRVKHRKVRL